MKPEIEITELLHAARDGDGSAMERVMEAVQGNLRRIAADLMRSERPGHTLQPTAVVNEAYLRVFQSAPPDLESRRHFFNVLRVAMRHVLVDHSRRRAAAVRGGGLARAELADAIPAPGSDAEANQVIIAAVERLRALHKRQADIFESVHLMGLTAAEAAEQFDVCERTVKRDLTMATLFLRQELGGKP